MEEGGGGQVRLSIALSLPLAILEGGVGEREATRGGRGGGFMELTLQTLSLIPPTRLGD